jgi:hypothetical protein
MPILTTVSTVIELARKLSQATAALKDAQVRLEMAELISQLVDLKAECSALADENADLKRRLAAEADPPKHIGSYYYFGEDGPYCTGCWDRSRTKVRIHMAQGDVRILGIESQCPGCKFVIHRDNRQPPPPPVIIHV